MSANDKAAPRETIPTHLLNRIENEWQQMRAINVPAPKPDLRVVPSELRSAKA